MDDQTINTSQESQIVLTNQQQLFVELLMQSLSYINCFKEPYFVKDNNNDMYIVVEPKIIYEGMLNDKDNEIMYTYKLHEIETEEQALQVAQLVTRKFIEKYLSHGRIELS